MNISIIKNKLPLVSIIIPCYNAEIFIAETLNSVLAQTYTHWECIVVDDHSTDKSMNIVQGYVESYPEKIKLIINHIKGACTARNKAFELSNGEFIQYLDADDLLDPKKIEVQLNALLNNKTNIAIGNWIKFKNNRNDLNESHQLSYLAKSNYTSSEWIIMNPLGCTHAWLIPRNIIQKAGLWDIRLKRNQDGEFIDRVVAHAQKVLFTPDAKVYYRAGVSNSISSGSSNGKINSSYLACLSYEQTINENFELTPQFKTAIANRFLKYCYIYGNSISKNFEEGIRKATEYGGGDLKPFNNKVFNMLNKIFSTTQLLLFKNLLTRTK